MSNEWKENLAYFDGDHWQFWIGPVVDLNKNHRTAEEINCAVKRVFQTNNLIRQCILRHSRSLVGRLPTWFLKDASGDRVDTEEQGEQTPAAEAELLLQRWFDRVYSLATSQECSLRDPFKEAVKNCAVLGYGDLRIWAPKKFRNAQDLVQRVAIHAPAPGTVAYLYDDDGFLDRINYSYQLEEKTYIESQFIDPATNETVFETQDDRGNTLTNTETGETQIRMNLGGRYTVYRIQAEPLITKSAKDAQNAINFILTMLMRNLEQAGFLERLILGAMPPGQTVEINGVEKFIPDTDFRIGAGQTSFLQGVPLYDEAGSLKGYSNPSVQYRDPVDVTTFEKSNTLATTVLYHQMGQGHLLSSDLNMSGIARVASRQDFDTMLEEHRTGTQSAIAGIMGAALMMMAPDPDRYKSLDVAVQLRFSTSKPLPEELKENRDDYQAGLKSRTTAMSAAGVEDPDGEKQLRIDEMLTENTPDLISQLGTLGHLSNAEVITLLKQVGALPQNVAAIIADDAKTMNGASS